MACKNRIATKPLDSSATTKANAAVGNKKCTTYEQRKKWMDEYIAALPAGMKKEGVGWKCADPKGKTPKEVKVKCCLSGITGLTIVDPCRFIPKGKTKNFEANGVPAGGNYSWTASGGISIVGGTNTKTVQVRGDTTSSAIDGAELKVTYRCGSHSRQASVNLTVYQIDKIQVTAKATLRVAARAGFANPADHAFDCTETAEAFPAAKSLVLMQSNNMQDVALQADVKPTGTTVWWDVRRASDDNASIGGATDLPTLKVDSSNPAKATLSPDKTGSFYVRVFGDCLGKKKFESDADFRLLPAVFVEATLNADNTVTSTAAFTATPSAGSVRISTGSFNIAQVRAGTANAAIYMNATVDLKSGGADGRRLLDCVFAGWINNLRSTTRSGNYAGPHVSEIVLATNRTAASGPNNRFIPGDPAPVPPALPILDTGRGSHGTGGETATLTRSRALNADKTNLAVGQRWRVEAVDSPGGGQGMAHPHFGTVLQRVHHEDNFTAFLSFWTNRAKTAGATADPANRIYAIIRSYRWDVLGEWTVGAAPGHALTVVTAPSVTTSSSSTHKPANEAHKLSGEVATPNIFDNLATDART